MIFQKQREQIVDIYLLLGHNHLKGHPFYFKNIIKKQIYWIEDDKKEN